MLRLAPLIGFAYGRVPNPFDQGSATWVQLFCPFNGLGLGGKYSAGPFGVRPSHGIISFRASLDEQTFVCHSE